MFLLNLPDIILAALLELNLQLTLWQGLKAVDAVKMIGVLVVRAHGECSILLFCRLNEITLLFFVAMSTIYEHNNLGSNKHDFAYFCGSCWSSHVLEYHGMLVSLCQNHCKTGQRNGVPEVLK